MLSNPTISAAGLCLYTLYGFGAAVLTACRRRGRELLTLSAPLGLAIAIVFGTILATSGMWSIATLTFWTLVVVSAGVHVHLLATAYWSHRQTDVTPSVRDSDEDARDETQFTHRTKLAETRLRLVLGALSVCGFVICVASALTIRHLNPGWGGLLSAIPTAWYVGLALLVVAILVGQQLRSALAGLPVILLQLVLTATPAIVQAADPHLV